MTKEQNKSSEPPAGRLGTFAGVFTPSILTILGIILFQRLGYVVGASGLIATLEIIGIATLISVITSLSLSAIATNIRVRGGGDYYLISRTLGAHYGGAIGLVLFLAQAVSVAFYCIGFGEAVASILGSPGDPATIASIAAVATLLVVGVAYMGADLATKFQFVVMAALGVALVAFFFGGIEQWNNQTLLHSLMPADSGQSSQFWLVFAVFFPAVTGFTQGVSMSGDLKDPSKSLPRGTFLAVGVSTVVYVVAAVTFAACLPLETLAEDYGAMRRVSVAPWLIEVGVIAATISSAMASCMGAPRILQSLAKDNIMPPLAMFAKGDGPTQNPRRAVLLTAAIALVTISLGNLNVVAAVVGMCFLLSYGLLNYATFFEARADSPAFRPKFKYFNAWLSLGGAGLCLGTGIMINPVAAAVAGACMVALHQYLRRTAPQAAWADSRYAYHFKRVRAHLLSMLDGSKHPRDWRPFVFALCNDAYDRMRLLTFASWIDGESGFTTAVRIMTPERDGDSEEQEATTLESEHLAKAESDLRAQVREAGLGTSVRVVGAPSVAEGMSQFLQSHGLGPLRPNTILMSAHEQFDDEYREGDAPPPEALAAAFSQRKNLILLEGSESDWKLLGDTPERERRIDVWWKDSVSSRLCLLLAHLMTRSEGWREAKIKVHVIANDGRTIAEALETAKEMLEDARIEADANAVEFSGPEDLIRHTRGAALVFLPLRVRRNRLSGPLGFPLAPSLSSLPVTALVVAGEDIQLDADLEHDTMKQDAPAAAAAK